MTTPAPTLCKLEEWTGRTWITRHAGIALLQPERYVQRLAVKGKVGRVTLLETGQIISPIPDEPCSYCDGSHPGPVSGMCLL